MDAEDKIEAIQIDAWLNKNHFRIVAAYNPPLNIPNTLPLQHAITKNTLVVGDFNAQSQRWGYPRTSAVGNAVEAFIDDANLQPIDTEPTFLSYAGRLSRPDLILPHVHLRNQVTHNLLDDPAGCGHRVIHMTIHPKSPINKNKALTRWNFKKANWRDFAKDSDLHITPDLIVGNPTRTFDSIAKAILVVAKKHIPRGQVKKYSPFWNSELTDLKEKRNEARKKAQRTQLLEDCSQLRKAQATLQHKIIQSKRHTFRTFMSNLDYRKDGPKAHRFISKLNNDGNSLKVNPIIHGNETIASKPEIAEVFCRYFARRPESFPRRKKNKPPLLPMPEREDTIMNTDFNIIELKQAIHALKTGKRCGPDEIFPEFVKNLGKNAKKVLLEAINETWKLGIPDVWRKAEIIPVHKKGKDPSLAKNYRPISLTSMLCKLTERMVNHRLQVFLENRRIIRDEQAGFRKHRSTTDQVIKLTQHIKDGFHRKMSTLACFIDFQGAYDTVSRSILLNKLSDLNVTGNMLRWLDSFLGQRFVKVMYSDATSRYRQQKRGLPQGAVLSCTLFNIMINDLIADLKRIPGVDVLCYADDLTVWASSSSIPALELTVNSVLARLKHWSAENDMIVSRDKTTAQLFTLSTKSHTISLIYDGSEIALVPTTKYLGMQVDNKLNWAQHVDDSAAKATKRLSILKRLAGTRWGATQDVLATTYKAYIRPVLEYGSEAFCTASEATKKKLNIAQNNALRVICGAAKSTPIAALESQTEVEPLEYRRDKATLKFFERSHRLSDHFWERYRSANPRLKTQVTPITHAQALQAKYNIDIGERQYFRKPHSLSDMRELPMCTYIPGIDKPKADLPPQLLKAAALEMLVSSYPSPEWLHVYTDGSAMEGSTGAGFFSSIAQGAFPVGKMRTNFDGEVAAISEAARVLVALGIRRKVVFLSDSSAALQALASFEVNDDMIAQCQERLAKLQDLTEICLQWVPGHCDIYGNEEADRLAKEGCKMSQPLFPVTYSSICNIISASIEKEVAESWRAAAVGKRWEPIVLSKPIPNNLPRDTAVATFRMATGHDYLQRHLYKIGVVDSPTCPLCSQEDGTADHLLHCMGLQTEIREDTIEGRARLYWAARRRMAELPRAGVG